MKKYKLIKTYPCSPEIGAIYTKAQMWSVLSGIVEKYPEFWEEVIETKLQYKVNCWSDPRNPHSHSLTDRGGWDIFSITRLADNVNFKIGDKTDTVGKIRSFEQESGGNLSVHGKTYLDCLEYIKHKKGVENPNPLNLEVGKSYTIKSVHRPTDIKTVTITHFTTNGHPWVESMGGIVSPGCYELVKKVIEKDYQILKIITNVNGRISDFSRDTEEYIASTLKCQGTSIHSVKRISDGEIFTVGDLISHTTVIVSISKINRITLNHHNNKLYFSTENCNHKFGTLLLNAVKDKLPLFTTEDGVDIFEGDVYKVINIKNWNIWDQTAKVRTELHRDYRAFNNVIKAEEYILLNKPCLSIKDIQSIYCSTYHHEKLTKLVKSKL